MNWCILRRFFVKMLCVVVLSILVMVLSYGILVIILPISVIAMFAKMYSEARDECAGSAKKDDRL